MTGTWGRVLTFCLAFGSSTKPPRPNIGEFCLGARCSYNLSLWDMIVVAMANLRISPSRIRNRWFRGRVCSTSRNFFLVSFSLRDTCQRTTHKSLNTTEIGSLSENDMCWPSTLRSVPPLLQENGDSPEDKSSSLPGLAQNLPLKLRPQKSTLDIKLIIEESPLHYN